MVGFADPVVLALLPPRAQVETTEPPAASLSSFFCPFANGRVSFAGMRRGSCLSWRKPTRRLHPDDAGR